MKRLLGTTAFVVAFLSGVIITHGAGVVLLHGPDFWPGPKRPPFVPGPPWPSPPHPAPRPAPLPAEIDSVQARVKINDQFANTEIDQVFYNPNASRLEATYLFPVPKRAHLEKFSMQIGGKPVEAELLKADQAKKLYEEVVRKLKDPGLLEYVDRDLVRVRLFPVEPNAKKRFTISYSQFLNADDGLVKFVLPLAAGQDLSKTASSKTASLSVKLDLETRLPLKSVYSPTHKIEINREGDRKATVGFETAGPTEESDFQLFYSQEPDPVDIRLLTHKEGDDDGFFLLLASPGLAGPEQKVVAKDVVFVLDTSGSMAGNKLLQAKKALRFCIENLNDSDRFNILRFSTDVEPLFNSVEKATDENRTRARSFIADLKPIGGTAIDAALSEALGQVDGERQRPSAIIFLTDGRPTVGNTDENQIVAGVKPKEHEKRQARIFCFGIGNDVNTHLLDRITEETRGYSQYVLPEEDIEVKVSNFYTKIKAPVLANPQLTVADGVRISKFYPAPLPDLFKGEQLVLAGRYQGAGKVAVTLQGTVNGAEQKFDQEVTFPEEATEHSFIPRLWATRRVGYLLDEIRLQGEDSELKDEVTTLARRYAIVTPYTAYLILEDEQQRGVAQNRRLFVPLEQNRALRRETEVMYEEFRTARSGGRAVAGARSSYSLKSADSAGDAISLGTTESVRAMPSVALTSPTPAGGYGGGVVATGVPGSPQTSIAIQPGHGLFGQRYRFAGGRAFYWTANEWIDSQIPTLAQAKTVQVDFASDAYFDLAHSHTEATAWLALGRNIQIVIGDTIYRISE